MSVLTAAERSLKPGLIHQVLGAGPQGRAPRGGPAQPFLGVGSAERRPARRRVQPSASSRPLGWTLDPVLTEGPRGSLLHAQRVPICSWVPGWRVTLDVLSKKDPWVGFFLLECSQDPISEADLETQGATAWASS